MSERILSVLKNFGNKLKNLDIQKLHISAYNKGYLTKYQREWEFYQHYYLQLFQASFQNSEPGKDAVFVDYGGGSGILTYLACEYGIKTVIYNDLFEQSVQDVKEISRVLGYQPSHLLHGDIKELNHFCSETNIDVDYVCSFDVLEHIYDLNNWFLELKNLPGDWQLAFITSANGANPWKNQQLKRIHRQSEYQGFEKNSGWKEMDSAKAYLDSRKEIIMSAFPELNQGQINFLGKITRGLAKQDILKTVEIYNTTGELTYKPNHPTNTCDPYTGNWNEHIIDLNELQTYLNSIQFSTKILNTTYAPSKNRIFNLPKYLLNQIIQLAPKHILQLSPMYILKVSKL